MLFAAPWMPRVRILPVTLVAMSVLLAACGSGSADPSPTPTPGPYTAPPGTPTPVVAPPDTPYRLVFREYGNTEDIIWRIVPGDPSQREKLGTIQHREGYGIVASLSPDGRMLAYLTLPEQALNEQSSQADVYVLDLKTNSNRLVTGGVDYQFRPLWSPDGQLLFLRRLAGAEVLSADVSIIYTKIVREPLEGEPTPTPTPRPTPTPTPLPLDQTPTPTPVPEDPIKTILKARYSQVMSFIPIGWADDNRSLYFVQVNGGTQGTTVVGAYFPATAESIAAEATPTPAPETPAPTPDPALPPPPPPPPPTPTPTPKPTSKFVMQLTEAAASDFILSGDMRKVAFASSSLVEGEFVNQVFIADLITSAITPIQEDGLPAGDRLGPVWHPDNNHITVGVLPFGGHAGGAVIVPLQLAQPQFLATSVSGYDIPRAWSPDATYLAVTNWSGPDLANSGDPSLDLVSPNGFRVRIGQGAGYAKTDAVIGWMVPS